MNTAYHFNPANDEEKMAMEIWDKLVIDAITENASDIHLEPFQHDSIIRYRIDGVLRPISKQTPSAIHSVIRVIKKLAGMNPDITDLPQDGKIAVSTDKTDRKEKTYDIRVSTLPTMFGEKMVGRILDPGSAVDVLKGGLSYLGLSNDDIKAFEELFNKPSGLVVVTGPTGSGKTTTVYAGLAQLAEKTEGRCNIVTIEDPVELAIEGVIQTQVNRDTDFDYINALKAVMRQDVDVIFLSDIPDEKIAKMAIQIAGTGHLLIAQIQAGDVATAIHRLANLCKDTYLLSTCLEGVISQRLMRKICPDCRNEVPVNQEIEDKIMKYTDKPFKAKNLWKGAGCEKCRESGYRGRMAVYEIVKRSDELTKSIFKNPEISELQELMRNMGVSGICKTAVEKALSGETTLEEAMRCSST